MNIKHLLKTIVILLVIAILFGAAMFGLNFITAPIIEENNKGAEFAPLLAVMPEADSFEDVTATLSGVPESVIAIYKETSGKGYVVRAKASTQYSKEPMEITFGVTADGKICGIQLDVYTDSIDFRTKDANYISSYLEKNSALADIGTVSGATYSSSAFKDAVSSGFSALITNQLIAEGVKSDAQILSEMIPTLAPGLTSSGIIKCTDIAASGNITIGYKAINDSGFAFIMTEGENFYLALVNSIGSVKIYDTEGNDVTESKSALAEEAKTASSSQTDYAEKLSSKIAVLMEGASDITPLTFDTFTNVVAAAEFKVGEAKYYAFYSRPLTYEDSPLDLYTVIDENGAIAKQEIPQLLFGHGVEYLPVYKEYGDISSSKYAEYENGFGGLTSDNFGDHAIITGATISSTAVKTATENAFDIFNTIKNGGAQ